LHKYDCYAKIDNAALKAKVKAINFGLETPRGQGLASKTKSLLIAKTYVMIDTSTNKRFEVTSQRHFSISLMITLASAGPGYPLLMFSCSTCCRVILTSFSHRRTKFGCIKHRKRLFLPTCSLFFWRQISLPHETTTNLQI